MRWPDSLDAFLPELLRLPSDSIYRDSTRAAHVVGMPGKSGIPDLLLTGIVRPAGVPEAEFQAGSDEAQIFDLAGADWPVAS